MSKKYPKVPIFNHFQDFIPKSVYLREEVMYFHKAKAGSNKLLGYKMRTEYF